MKSHIFALRFVGILAAAAALLCSAERSAGQSLFERSPNRATPARQQPTSAPAPSQNTVQDGPEPASDANRAAEQPQPVPAATAAEPRQQDDPNAPARAAAAQLEAYSLMVVVPPKPRTFQKHDLIEIIINENSTQKIEQSLDTTKRYDIRAELSQFPSLKDLLEFQLRNGIGTPVRLGVNSNTRYNGDGEAERKDRFTARIAAEVIDVKPNGNLVLEARKSIEGSGGDKTFMVLGGVCRSADITSSNTVQSSQIANMALRIEGEGDVKNAAKKGLIPRVLETIFNF
ncbi:MAG: flagellar basal body L-ring protein FlgH [Phycisphaeraceae bacterium]|nr:flagellar basal body L-ring protein FlgH [Phycisphaeraceae bacterium]